MNVTKTNEGMRGKYNANLSEFDYTDTPIETDFMFKRTFSPSAWVPLGNQINRLPVVKITLSNGTHEIIKDMTLTAIASKTQAFVAQTFRGQEIVINPRYLIKAESYDMVALQYENKGNDNYNNGITTDRYLVNRTPHLYLSVEP